MKMNRYPNTEKVNILAEEARVDTGKEHRENVVLIPTYNEAGNLKRLVPTILRQGPFDILIIDDHSPDGTGEVAEDFAKRFPGQVSVLHRPGKLGLGTAYLAGFDYALAQGYQQVFTMDADFSHDPSRLPALREALEEADVVLGSRYVPGGGTQRWPLRRRLLSRGGSAYARLVLGLPIRDLTGGFKGFRRQVLEALLPELETIRSHGYAFQIEMTYRCARLGFHIVEVPILFEDRVVGTSKMNRRIVAEALWVVLALRLSQGSARPRTDAQPPARRARRRVLPVALALVVFLFVLGTVNFAPGWAAHVLRGTSVPATSLSHVPPAAAVQKRSRLAPVAPRVARSTPGASLQLQGTDLTPNVPLRFAGAGFGPGETLVVTIEDAQGRPEAQLAPLSADQTGHVSATAEVLPADLPPGVHTLLLQGASSHHTAQAAFQLALIPPTVQLDTYTIKPGQAFGFAGGGFLPNEAVEVRLGSPTGTRLAVVNANAGGNVSGRVMVPLMAAGTYPLFFVGQQSQTPSSVDLNIQGFHPWVTLDTYAPSSQTRLGFQGEDFAPGEKVLVYLNQRAGEPVLSFQADASGRLVAPAAWEVEKLSGENTLIFVGLESGAVVTTTFTVVA